MQTFYKRGNNVSTLTVASTDLAMNARRAKQQKEEMNPFATILKEKIDFYLQNVYLVFRYSNQSAPILSLVYLKRTILSLSSSNGYLVEQNLM